MSSKTAPIVGANTVTVADMGFKTIEAGDNVSLPYLGDVTLIEHLLAPVRLQDLPAALLYLAGLLAGSGDAAPRLSRFYDQAVTVGAPLSDRLVF